MSTQDDTIVTITGSSSGAGTKKEFFDNIKLQQDYSR
jgi:hypothetical protein